MSKPSITTNLLSTFGMIGNNTAGSGSLVPRASTPQAQQELYRNFIEQGEVANPDIWTRYNSAMRHPTTFEQMLELWEDMSSWDLMAAALVEIVDEATQTDSNSPATIWYECNDKQFEDELNQMVVNTGVEDLIQSQVWHVAGLGNHFEKIEYAPGEGVIGLTYVHPTDIRRYWLERNRKCIGFKWKDHKPDKESAFVGADNQTPIQRVALSDGQNVEDLWYPWDFLHFRRMFRLRFSEHGEPIFDEAQGIYKKLKLAVDQMVVMRAQLQPVRYAVNIDVKDQPPAEQAKTVQRWKQSLRSKLAFGSPSQGPTGQFDQPSDFQSFYNAWALDTILWVAKPREFNHAVERLEGTRNVPDVYDIEMLIDLFYSIIGMPRGWVNAHTRGGGGGGDENPPSGKALLAQDMRFLRKIKSIRKPIVNCYTWLGYLHAVLKGKDISRLDIRAQMPPIGGLEEQMKMELLKAQAEVLQVMAEVMEAYNLPKEAWVEVIFKKYMHLPDDIVNIFITALPGEMDAVPVESMGNGRAKKPAPYTYKLIRQIDEAVANKPGAKEALEQLKLMMNYESPASVTKSKMRRWKRIDEVIEVPRMKDMDLIVSSYGRHPFELKRSGANDATPGKTVLNETTSKKPKMKSVTESKKNGSSPYRRWMPNGAVR